MKLPPHDKSRNCASNVAVMESEYFMHDDYTAAAESVVIGT